MLFYALSTGYFLFFSFAEETYVIIKTSLDKNILNYTDINTLYFSLLLGVFCLILTKFSFYHITLIVKNSTTIESLENNYNHCYSISLYRNFIQVFGRNPWMWMLPFYGKSGKPSGDGIIWPMLDSQYSDSDVNVESEANREHSVKPLNPFSSPDRWPPEQKSESTFSNLRKSPSDAETDISFIKVVAHPSAKP